MGLVGSSKLLQCEEMINIHKLNTVEAFAELKMCQEILRGNQTIVIMFTFESLFFQIVL